MRFARLLVSAELLVTMVLGCQCLAPVDDGTGVLDASQQFDAGGLGPGPADAGECQTHRDCSAGSQTFPCSFMGAPPNALCLDRRCVRDCGPGDTCQTEGDARCVRCDQSGRACAPQSCTVQKCSMQVESSTCATLPVGATFAVTKAVDCKRTVVSADGGSFGWWFDQAPGEAVGRFAAVGTCRGRGLFTNVPRIAFLCPGGCEAVFAGCE